MDREAAIRETATDREAAAIRETAMDREAAAIRETVTDREAAIRETVMDREAAAIRETVMDREAAIRETVTDREAAAIRETAMDREAAAIRETVTDREAAAIRETVTDREAAAIRETAMDREAAAIRETAMDREAAAIRETVTDREAAAIRAAVMVREGGRDGRGGLNIPKPSFDSPVVQKPQNNKQNKNNYKNDKYSKIDHEEEMHSKGRGGKNVKSAVQPPQKKEAKVEEIKTITIPEVITIKDLADKMKLQPSVIVKKLFLQGKVVTINQEVDYEQAEEIAMEFDVLCEKEVKVDVIEELLKEEEEDEKDMVTRPPVVCVMGHVDHGKTSLLDAIRQTNVTAKEAGGITQHIGAYMVEINGQKITFLDTPGHEAFTAMRMRGAKSTDIAILVVAADDGVMPQTIEAINHAKAAGVEIIVAINKIDKPSANIEKVKQELIEYELIPEDWGGSTIFVPVSAHTKEGIKELLEMILLTAEVKELKANPNRNARGLVIEAELDKGKGPVATVLVQKGTLHVGDPIAAGACYGQCPCDDGR